MSDADAFNDLAVYLIQLNNIRISFGSNLESFGDEHLKDIDRRLTSVFFRDTLSNQINNVVYNPIETGNQGDEQKSNR